MRRFILPIMPALALACSDAAQPTTSGTLIQLSSDPGDPVGSGKTYEYSSTNATFQTNPRTDTFAIYVAGPDQGWTGVFSVPPGRLGLEPGVYLWAERFDYNNPARPGLSWFGINGCSTLTGWFAVKGVHYADTTLTAIDLSFEQHCEGLPPALHGEIHWVR
jgi:hypothetical protein